MITPEYRAAARKLCVETWIAETLEGDAALERCSEQFAERPEATLRPHMPALKARGVAVYVGSGNVFLVDLKPAAPVILQRRPLAQRTVTLTIPER